MVNPTHIAVAIYLDPENGVMPLITVKGKGMYALAVRRYAEKHRVPVVRDIRLPGRYSGNIMSLTPLLMMIWISFSISYCG